MLLLTLLHRRGHFAFDARSRRTLPRIAAAALGMGVVVAVVERLLTPYFTQVPWLRLAALGGLVGSGLAAFALLALLLGAADLGDLKRRFRRQPA